MSALAHFPHPHRRYREDAGLLDPGHLLEGPAAAGLGLLWHLDHLGGRVEARFRAHRAAIPATSRLSPATAVVAAGVVVFGGLLAYGVHDASAGANTWMTAPGAGNEQAALAQQGQPGGATAAAAVPAKHHGASAQLTVHERLVVVDGSMTGHPGAPEFVGGAQIDFPANARIDLTIYNFDDGPAPLPKGLPYDKVMGTVGGSETYDGHSISSVSNKVVSHTFTVPGIGLNVPLPAARATKAGVITPAVVEASFVTTKKGSFTWQCYAPCGSGKNGTGGAMKVAGEMTGTVRIG